MRVTIWRRCPGALSPLAGCVVLAACGGTLDAGTDRPHGLLPVDERNPIILNNDAIQDNWQAEYALLFASAGGPAVAGMIVNSSSYWPDIEANVAEWMDLVTAARASGIRDVPTPTTSVGKPLVRPASGDVDATVANQSEGGRLIVEASARLGRPSRPLVVVTGGRLTDLADAYLMDHTVVERVVVVAALGIATDSGGEMGQPNGDLDPWANWIVAQRYRYVQVSAYYDQLTDVPDSLLPSLPDNPFGTWVASKQPRIRDLATAADQVAVIAVALPTFVVQVLRAAPDTSRAFDSTAGPALLPDAAGSTWLVTHSAPALATARFWQLLLDPHTYGARGSP